MRMDDVPLRHMGDIVATCIVLHNMNTIEKNKFDMEWIKTIEKELKWLIENRLLKEWQGLRVVIVALSELRNIIHTKNIVGRDEDLDRYTQKFW